MIYKAVVYDEIFFSRGREAITTSWAKTLFETNQFVTDNVSKRFLRAIFLFAENEQQGG